MSKHSWLKYFQISSQTENFPLSYYMTHCTLDKKMIGKADPTRYFVPEKVTEGAFRATIKDDQKIV